MFYRLLYYCFVGMQDLLSGQFFIFCTFSNKFILVYILDCDLLNTQYKNP